MAQWETGSMMFRAAADDGKAKSDDRFGVILQDRPTDTRFYLSNGD
jgi:hypothetical protein